MKAHFKKHILKFKRAAGTSRNTLTQKPSWFIFLEEGDKIGIGEVGIIPGLSPDVLDDIEIKLKEICERPEFFHSNKTELINFPAIVFGLETAFISLNAKDPFILFENDFSLKAKPIEINGLVWMGDQAFMKEQISDLIDKGYSCIKMKIGAIDFATEVKLLKSIRNDNSKNDIELRLDANGAFSPNEALEKLETLSQFDIHSIEQPIAANQLEEMAKLCENSPIPIALDEELIGRNEEDISKVLDVIRPQYIILKPGLHGGFERCDQWIKEAEKRTIGWWATSALESNVGLNAIAQWTASKGPTIPQGLGTGSLYTNNVPSPLEIIKSSLVYSKNEKWDLASTERPYIINGKAYSESELLLFIRDSENAPEWEKKIFRSIEEWFDNKDVITFHTSGSTSIPKEILHSKESIGKSVELTAQYFELNSKSTILLALPAEYVAGKMMIYRALHLKCDLHYIEPSSMPKIDQAYNFASFVPMQVEKMMNNSSGLNKIKKVLIGGAPLASQLMDKIKTLSTEFYESYGMTETLTHMALRRVGEEFFKALPSIEFSESKGSLNILAPHISDEVIHTNDLVKLKDNKMFELLGRKDDVINSGGVKIHPSQVERKLERIILEPFYIGSEEDDLLGEKVVLFIEGNEIGSILSKAILNEMKLVLGKFEVPQKTVFVPTFKRTFSGKIIRNKNERSV